MDVAHRLRQSGVYLTVKKGSTALTPEFTADELKLANDIPRPERRNDFLLGRRAAHEALQLAGFEGVAVLPRTSRSSPSWPLGFTGSISHTAGLVGAITSPTDSYSSIGLDIESRSRTVSPGLGPRIMAELEDKLGRSPLQLFSIKEACYKAIRPLSTSTFAFKQIQLSAAGADQLKFTLRVDGCNFCGDIICGEIDDFLISVALIPPTPRG